MEKLRSYYMDRGYANFQIESTQVTIAPEKDDMYITMNVNEGDVYRVSDIKLAGTMVVPEEQLRKLLVIHPGDIYSRKFITSSQELMSYRLGADGYAFAKIDPVPTTDNEKKTVSLTFFIEPGNRVYVRHINFNNTTAINDETLRREMRQLEGGWLSNSAVERSKERLQRLPYVEKVEFETKPVSGSADLVDVDFNIKEGLPGQFGGGIGYSEAQGISLNGNFVHSNFMGTGDRIAVEINAGRYSKSYVTSHTDPYTTIDGVARTTSFTLSRHNAIRGRIVGLLDQAAHRCDAVVLSHHRVPVPAGRHIRQQEHPGGLPGVQRAAGHRLGQEQRQHLRRAISTDTNGDGVVNSLDSPYTVYGTDFYTYELTAGWNLRCAQPRLVRRPGPASGHIGPLRDPAERHTLLRDQFPVPAVRPHLAQMAAVLHRAASTTPRRWARTTALPPYLNYFARRPGQRSRLSREHLGSPGQHRHRQPVRRKLSRGQPPGADIPRAREVEERGPGELVLRHGQCVPDRQQGAIPGGRRHNPGQLPLQLW